MDRRSYYAIHGHIPQSCWTCDRKPCVCPADVIRSIKRSAKGAIRRETLLTVANYDQREIEAESALLDADVQGMAGYFADWPKCACCGPWAGVTDEDIAAAEQHCVVRRAS